jgi:acetyl esterase/lipase
VIRDHWLDQLKRRALCTQTHLDTRQFRITKEQQDMTTDFTTKELVYTIAGAADVAVERDHIYRTDQGPLGFDLYRPPHATAPSPVVILVSGLPDPGVAAMLGKPIKDWASYQGWARMIAASGIVGILYLNRTSGDVVALVHHLRANAAELGIDPERIGVWASSGHAPTALALFAHQRLACAALLYGYLLDLDGATAVADAAAQYHFAVPPVALEELPRDRPMLVVRAGRDVIPGIDATLQRFVAAAHARQLPVTLIEHAEAPHAFDLIDDSPRTREVIEETLGFLRRALA